MNGPQWFNRLIAFFHLLAPQIENLKKLMRTKLTKFYSSEKFKCCKLVGIRVIYMKYGSNYKYWFCLTSKRLYFNFIFLKEPIWKIISFHFYHVTKRKIEMSYFLINYLNYKVYSWSKDINGLTFTEYSCIWLINASFITNYLQT